jgi:site-specific recombinase XerD
MERSLQRFLRHHRAGGHSADTIQWHSDGVGNLIGFLKAKGYPVTVDDLDADYVRDWIAEQQERGLAQMTIAARVKSVKALTRWLVSEEWLAKDPLARLKAPKVDDVPKETLSPAEVDTLLRSCNRATLVGVRDTAIMLLLFSTGLRASELIRLQPGDIDWDRGLITIRRGKGGKLRVIPMGPKVEKALDRYLSHPKRKDGDTVFLSRDGKPFTRVALRAVLRRRGDQAGIHCNPHKWRHSAAIAYLRNGGRVETLKTLLGHSKLDQSMHYARIAGVDLTTAHETADPTRSLRTRV